MLDSTVKLDLFRRMLRIRRVEEAIADRYPQQKMRTPVHLSIGQEAVATISGYLLTNQDYAVSTHRAHAHYLGKGGSLKAMIAEMHGKVTGCCRGRGGSMHLIDTSVGFMGSTAIVGNTIPIGVGLGLAAKLANEARISCVFLGDGAIEEGVFFESLNFAILKQLPVIFICENNRYSVYSPFEKRQPADRNIYDIAKAMGAQILHADGYDIEASYSVLHQGINGVREGKGTYFVELETYRWREHCGPYYDNDIGYRTEAEYQSWRERDALEKLQQDLMLSGDLSKTGLEKIEAAITSEIDEAFLFADESSFPAAIEAFNGQYKSTRQAVIDTDRISQAVVGEPSLCNA